MSSRARPVSAPAKRARAFSMLDGAPPDVHARLAPYGEDLRRTMTYLAELIAESPLDAYPVWAQLVDAIEHEVTALREKSFKNGSSHGRWLQEKDMEKHNAEMADLYKARAQLYDTTVRFQILQQKYLTLRNEQAKVEHMSDISNLTGNTDTHYEHELDSAGSHQVEV